MQQVNPSSSINDEYYKKLWNHLYAISEYKLDVDYPYEVKKHEKELRPEKHMEYNLLAKLL